MKISLFSPTVFELSPSLKYLENAFELKDNVFSNRDLQVQAVVSGVGLVNTTLKVCSHLHEYQPDLCILAGVAGTYSDDIKIGEVVNVIEESYGDLGAEDSDGNMLSLFDLKLLDEDQFPFSKGKLLNHSKDFKFLKQVRSISLQKSSGHEPNIHKLKESFDPHIENMEGAAFFQTCLSMNVPFLQIRAISNKVESRNKDNWNLPLAIDNLNKILIEMIQSIA